MCCTWPFRCFACLLSSLLLRSRVLILLIKTRLWEIRWHEFLKFEKILRVLWILNFFLFLINSYSDKWPLQWGHQNTWGSFVLRSMILFSWFGKNSENFGFLNSFLTVYYLLAFLVFYMLLKPYSVALFWNSRWCRLLVQELCHFKLLDKWFTVH